MRIRQRKRAAECSVSSSPSPESSSSSSSFSSYTSSVTAAHSLASSQDSSNSCPLSLFSTASPRCRGLDLLVKAIHQVNAGSVVGVPYIQRRVTIRRRRRSHGLDFDAFVLDGLRERKRGGRIAKKVSECEKTKKAGKNLVGLSSRIQDSALQPRRRRSDRADEMGLTLTSKKLLSFAVFFLSMITHHLQKDIAAGFVEDLEAVYLWKVQRLDCEIILENPRACLQPNLSLWSKNSYFHNSKMMYMERF